MPPTETTQIQNTAGEPAAEGDVTPTGDEVGGVVEDVGETPEIQPATAESESMETPTFLTSEDARTDVKKAEINLDQAREQLEDIRQRATVLQDSVNNISKRRQERLSKSTPEEGIKSQTDQTRQELIEINSQIDEDYADISNALETYKKNSDSITAEVITNVQNQFNVRRNQMAQTYEVLADMTKISNIRSGRERYAPIRAASLITTVEQQKISKLADLDVLEQKTILEARQAQLNNDWNVMTRKMEAADDYRAEKRQTMLDLQDLAIQEDQRLRQAREEIRTQVEFEYQEALRRAEAASARVAQALESAPTEEDKQLVIEEFSQQLNVNPDLLNTMARDRMRQLRLEELDILATQTNIENTRSLMAERDRTTEGTDGTVTVTTGDGETVEYNLSTTSGVKEALADGMSEADIRVALERKKFTQGTINALIDGAKGLGDDVTSAMAKKAVEKFADKVGFFKRLLPGSQRDSELEKAKKEAKEAIRGATKIKGVGALTPEDKEKIINQIDALSIEDITFEDQEE